MFIRSACRKTIFLFRQSRGVVIERERTVRSVLNGLSVLFLSQPLRANERRTMRS